MTGHTVGGFEVLEPLGQGAAGVAYRARCRDTGDLVALKMLGEAVANDPEMQKRFVREVSVLEKLDHPGIVRHHDCGLHEGQIYFAMELVDSGSLDEVLTEGGVLPWREAAEVAEQVSAALAYAHSAGVVHRDLKPANLFLSSEGKVKIGDFGLARDSQAHRLTMQGQTVGTCRYMAPEQVRGEDELTGAVDMYALGCLLYLMLTGDCPFTGSSVVEVFEHHLFSKPARLSERGVACPEELVELVDRLLAKSPQDRPDAEATQEAFAAILRGEKPDLPGAASQEAPAKNLTQRLKESSAPAPQQVNTTALIITAIVILVGIVAAVLSQ